MFLHDAHCHQQLVAEIGIAIFHIGEGGERPEHVPTVFFPSEVRFHAPQGEQDPAFDLKLLLDHIECFCPFAAFELCVGDAPFRYDGVHVVADGFAVFRLTPGRGDHPLIGGEALHGGIERRAADALCLRIRPQRCEKSRNGLFLAARWRHQHDQHSRNSQVKSDEHDDWGIAR